MYKFWLMILFIIPLISMILFFPNYNGELYPLFLDIQTMLLFIPAYSIFLYGTIFHIIKKQITNISYLNVGWGKKLKSLILILYLVVVSFFSIYVQDFSTKFSIIVSIMGAAIGYIALVCLDILSKNQNDI